MVLIVLYSHLLFSHFPFYVCCHPFVILVAIPSATQRYTNRHPRNQLPLSLTYLPLSVGTEGTLSLKALHSGMTSRYKAQYEVGYSISTGSGPWRQVTKVSLVPGYFIMNNTEYWLDIHQEEIVVGCNSLLFCHPIPSSLFSFLSLFCSLPSSFSLPLCLSPSLWSSTLLSPCSLALLNAAFVSIYSIILN